MNDLSLIKVKTVEPLGGYRLRVHFSDGSSGERDFGGGVAEGGPMVEPLRDPAYFARVFIEFGALTWPNGYDLAPNALYAEMAKAGLLQHTTAARA